MIVQISNGTVYFGANDVFENIDFTVNENERIALVGRNGSGKTTLLKVLTGECELSSGQLIKANKTSISYLKQNALALSEDTIGEVFDQVFAKLKDLEKQMEELSDAMKEDPDEKLINKYSALQEEYKYLGGYTYQSEMLSVLAGFGFKESDLERKVSSFSGGEKTKIAFASLLLAKPDLLLLDEPTNHLDLSTIEWLENYLAKYKKAMVIVSHDRMFLDKTVNVVYELEYGSIRRYAGNYSSFVEQKKNDLIRQESAYRRQQKDIKRLEELIEKFRYKKNKAAFAQSKIKYLERMERIEDPKKADTKAFKAKFVCGVRGGKNVLSLDHFEVGYDKPLANVSLEIKRGDRICVMGDNGTGKSTLLKSIIGETKPLGGYMMLGHQIQIGYFDQNLANFHNGNTVLEELWNEHPDLDMFKIRSVLGAFLFTADEVFKEVDVLSGGEKVRLSLAKLMMKKANFLILDEPTNHLDIISKEALENALNEYDGTILFVSHDRYFIRKIATSCLVIDTDKVTYYPDGYKDYIDAKVKEAPEKVKEEKNEVPLKELKQKPKYNIKRLENEISLMEDILEDKRALRYEPEYYQDMKKMAELDDEIDEIHNKIHALEEKWEEAMLFEEEKNK
ncbi:MAG: ABC-F family ATP-binding cassette domain-containing protein [Erysipelotrichaceae bacterium]|nr:ABC-F family ATP-binding cassette domain-containing protein [Erysipelotrichaceae bacterium]MBQ1322450.1 ABC-F family ATP-binding cassette domain-containing protein [Erysipelotrichaceae bacterium]MBQ5555461.1 ABC-F family ATP-binding cassette domain-containing protein [Erysipelotrichaceae bacterium]